MIEPQHRPGTRQFFDHCRKVPLSPADKHEISALFKQKFPASFIANEFGITAQEANLYRKWRGPFPQTTPQQRAEVHSLRNEGLTYEQIARRVGIHNSTVSRIMANKRARSVDNQGGSNVSPEERDAIIALVAQGWNLDRIGKLVGRSVPYISKYVSGVELNYDPDLLGNYLVRWQEPTLSDFALSRVPAAAAPVSDVHRASLRCKEELSSYAPLCDGYADVWEELVERGMRESGLLLASLVTLDRDRAWLTHFSNFCRRRGLWMRVPGRLYPELTINDPYAPHSRPYLILDPDRTRAAPDCADHVQHKKG